jgi:membrane-bound ClpP family serine protease
LALLIAWAASSGHLQSGGGIVLVLLIYGALLVGVGRMAVAFDRSAAVWVILAVVFTPLTAAVFLFVAGAAPEAPRQPNSVYDHSIDGHTTCPGCGAAVDWAQGEGLHSPADEPWRLLCDQCESEVVADPA